MLLKEVSSRYRGPIIVTEMFHCVFANVYVTTILILYHSIFKLNHLSVAHYLFATSFNDADSGENKLFWSSTKMEAL